MKMKEMKGIKKKVGEDLREIEIKAEMKGMTSMTMKEDLKETTS